MSDFNQQLIALMPFLRNYALKIAGSPDEAAELVQDCLERALRKSHLYRPGTNFKAWIFTMMRNLLINQKRRDKVFRRYTDRLQTEARESVAPTQITHVLLSQTLSAMAGLGVEEQEAMRLLGIEEHTYDDAANALGLPLGTLKSRLFRARSKLRANLALGEPGSSSTADSAEAA